MAAIFQIRRGSGSVSLVDGEIYLHKTSGSLQVAMGTTPITLARVNDINYGSIYLQGDITASNAYFSGDVAISGNLFLGNTSGDNISVPGVFTTNLVPGTNGTLDLGTPGARWKTIYATSISGEIAATNGIVSGSSQVIGILDSLNTFSGSQLTQNTALATISGSLISSASTAKTTNDSQDISITNLNTNSASVNISVEALNSKTGSYATTGSNIFVGNQTISGSLTISGSSALINIGPTILSGSVLVSGSINSDGYELEATSTQTIPALNSTFNLDLVPSGSTTTFINKSLVLGDGKILVAGRFQSIDGHTTNDIARLNSDGTIDTSFVAPMFSGSNFVGGDTAGWINTFVTQSDGKIVVGGNFIRVGEGGDARRGIARLNTNGTLDETFAIQSFDSFASSNGVRDLVIQNDGKIVFVGTFTSGSRRVNTDGTIDTSFDISQGNNQPLAFNNGDFYSVALLDSGSEQAILIGGSFTQWGSLGDYHHLVKLNPNGTLDSGFAGNNLDIATGNSSDRIVRIKVTDAYSAGDNGYIYIAGRFKDTRIGPDGRNAGFARLTTDDVAFGRGAYDNGFRLYISGSDQNTPGVQYVNDFDFYDGDKILIGGSFTSIGNPLASYQSVKRFIIVDDGGGLIDGFSSSTYNLNTGSVNSVTLLSNDNVLVGGTFTQANSTAREGLASFKLTGLGEVTTTSEYSITADTTQLLVSSSNTYFSGDVNISGSVTASIFSGSFIGDGSGLSGVTANEVEYEDVLNKPTLVSGSSQIISILNPLNNFSASVTASLDSIYQTTASLNLFTASVTASLESIYQTTSSLNEFTASQLTKDNTLANYTASVENRLTEIGVVSGSLISTASAHNTSITELNNWSGSAKIQIYELENKSASVDISLTNIHSYTSSLKTAFELTGSNVVVLGDLTVKGTTTQIDSTTIQLGDNIIELNGSSAANGGLLVKDVTNPNTISGSLLWDSTNDYWKGGALGNESKVLLANGDNVLTSSLQLTEINNTTASLNKTTESLNSFSASVTASLESIYQTTASLNLFSASVTSSLESIYQTTASLNLFSASVTASLESIYQTTASLNNHTSSTNDDLASLHQTTASLNLFSASVTSSLESIYQTTSSLNLFSASVTASLESIYQTTASLNVVTESLNNFSASVTASLESIYQTTASLNVVTESLNLFSASVTASLESIYQTTASLNDFSASVTASLEAIYQTTASLNDFSVSVTASLEAIYQTTASLNLFSASVTASLEAIYQTTASLNDFSASVTSSLESIYQTTSSLNDFSASVTASLESIYQTTASLNTFTSSQLTQNETLSQVTASIHQFTASLNTYTGATEIRLDELEYTASISIGAGLLNEFVKINEFTASAKISIDNLESFTSSFSESVSASIAGLASASGYINYVTNSIEQLTGIEVADFDNNVAVTFINGTLKFIFGTPAIPTSIVSSLSGFAADRFNNVNDAYIVNGTWSNQGYTLVSASLYEGSTLLTQVGSGTSLSFSTTTSGSHTYRLEYTASSPLDGTLFTTSTTTTGTISKSNPASPTLTLTPTVQLGASGNQIEQGATGSISFTSSSANPSNSWNLINTTTNVSTPYFVTGSATGSTSISIIATANYESPIGDNIPDLTTTSTATTTYTKIRSLRRGASTNSSFTIGELENLSLWDTTLGGEIGTIAKGTTNPSGQSVTISWTGDKFHYIVFDSSRSNLSNITTSGFGVFEDFVLSTIGQYKVYKSTTLKAGGAGSSITYTLT